MKLKGNLEVLIKLRDDKNEMTQLIKSEKYKYRINDYKHCCYTLTINSIMDIGKFKTFPFLNLQLN